MYVRQYKTAGLPPCCFFFVALVHCNLFIYFTLYHVAYITGSTISVSMVATSRPPLNAMASGLQNTDPMSGIIPRMAAMAVSMIGLKRNIAELMMASRADCPSAR